MTDVADKIAPSHLMSNSSQPVTIAAVTVVCELTGGLRAKAKRSQFPTMHDTCQLLDHSRCQVLRAQIMETTAM
jgi:hypothetical protein